MTSFADIDIRGILPQREPFLFVDRLLHYDDGETVTAFTVPEGHLLVEEGKLTTSGVLENMAQSSAARIGYLSKYILHVPVRVGYIGAIRKFRLHRQPAVGETLETKILLREDVFGISLVDAVVQVGNEIIAEGSLKTALGEKDPAHFTVLLLHSPLYLDEAAEWGADLTLAGHFHGGTIRLFGRGLMTPQYQFFYPRCQGMFSFGEKKGIVSAGLGTHSVNVRLFDRPEAVLVTLKQEDEAF